MTKKELVDKVAENTELTKKDTDEIVNTCFETIMEYLKSEAEKPEEEREKVQITGFGAFDVRDRAARKGRNPNTGETISIESRKFHILDQGNFLERQWNRSR